MRVDLESQILPTVWGSSNLLAMREAFADVRLSGLDSKCAGMIICSKSVVYNPDDVNN